MPGARLLAAETGRKLASRRHAIGTPLVSTPPMPHAPARRLRAAALLLAAPPAACVSGGASRTPVDDPRAGIPTTTRVEGAGGTAELRTYGSAVATTEAAVPAPSAKAFSSLPVVYEALGLPVNTVQSDAGTFGAREMRMPRRLGKASLSQYVDCGTNPTGSPNADVYMVTMTVISRVTPAAGGSTSTVVTQLTATARPVAVSGNTVQCSSTGRLEQAINTRLAAEAAR